MFLGAGVSALLVGAVGSVLLVCAVLLAGRWGARRSVGAAGAGLLLLGLAVSGVVGILAQALAVGLNPVRWLGLAAAGVGVLMLSWSGMLPGRRGRRRPGAAAGDEAREVGTGRGRPPAQRPVDDDLAEIEDILRRRGIE
jgi:hypothetical protein